MSHSWPGQGTLPPDKPPPREKCPICGRYYTGVECPSCKPVRVRIHEAPTSLPILIARIAVFTILVITPVSAANVITLWFLNLVTDASTWIALLLVESVVLMFIAYARSLHFLRGDGLLSHTDFWISVGVAGFVLLVFAANLALQYY